MTIRKLLPYLFTIIFILYLTGCQLRYGAAAYSVKRVSDGDTIRVVNAKGDELQKLIQQGGDRVNLTITDSDRYGRKVSEVRLGDGTLVQEVMAREGLVLVYAPYLKNCPSAAAVERAATQGREQHRGVWSDAKFIAPWQYRSAKR